MRQRRTRRAKALRLSLLGWTQAEIAERLGVSQPKVSQDITNFGNEEIYTSGHTPDEIALRLELLNMLARECRAIGGWAGPASALFDADDTPTTKKRPPTLPRAGVSGIDPTDTSSETSTHENGDTTANPVHERGQRFSRPVADSSRDHDSQCFEDGPAELSADLSDVRERKA